MPTPARTVRTTPSTATRHYERLEALCDTSSSAGAWAAMVEITSRKLQDIEGALDRLQRGT